MKFVGQIGEALVFDLSPEEHHLIYEILSSYPILPPEFAANPDPTSETPHPDLHLEEVFTEHQQLLRRRLEDHLNRGGFSQEGERFRWSILLSDFEWLLQVINDIRVGSWIHLGSPADIHSAVEATKSEETGVAVSMEVAGYLQMQLLEACGSGSNQRSE